MPGFPLIAGPLSPPAVGARSLSDPASFMSAFFPSQFSNCTRRHGEEACQIHVVCSAAAGQWRFGALKAACKEGLQPRLRVFGPLPSPNSVGQNDGCAGEHISGVVLEWKRRLVTEVKEVLVPC